MLLLVTPAALAPPPALPAQDASAGTQQVVHDWLASDLKDVELRGKATQAILAEGAPALRWFGRLLQGGPAEQSLPEPLRGRTRALDSLLSDVALSFLKHESGRGVFYAGQYSPLEPLMPKVGEVYLGLMLDTPQWFPSDRRVLLVPALRDLFPGPPAQEQLDRLRQIANDEEFEPAPLRTALGHAFAQWGDRSFVEQQFAELQRQLEDEAAAVGARKALAELHYELREYRQAAEHGVQWLRAGEQHGSRIVPLDYYNVTCYLSLAGRIDDAFAELKRAVDLHADEHTDPSWRIERKLFVEDPELRALRKDPRFAALQARAFPEPRKR